MSDPGPGSERDASVDAVMAAVLQAHERVLRAGEPIFEPGEAGTSLFVVRSGEIELSRSGPRGARRLSRVGPGESFGELAALRGGPRTLRATATRDTRVLELDRESFEAMCLDEPVIAWQVIHGLAARLEAVEAEIACSPAEAAIDSGRTGAPIADESPAPARDADAASRAALARALSRRTTRTPAGGVRVSGTLRTLAEASGLDMRDAHRIVQEWIERRLLQLVDDELVASDLDALQRIAATA